MGTLQKRVDTFVDRITTNTQRVTDELGNAESGEFTVMQAALGFNLINTGVTFALLPFFVFTAYVSRTATIAKEGVRSAVRSPRVGASTHRLGRMSTRPSTAACFDWGHAVGRRRTQTTPQAPRSDLRPDQTPGGTPIASKEL